MVSVLKYYIQQTVCWLLLLQLVNISVDPPDMKAFISHHRPVKQVNEVNEIESIYELLSEELLHNDIPEGEEQDIEKTVKSVELYFSKPSVHAFYISQFCPQHKSQYRIELCGRSALPVSPPPEQV